MRLFQALRKEKYKPWDPVFDSREPAEHGGERQICGKLRSQRKAGGMLYKCAGLQGEESCVCTWALSWWGWLQKGFRTCYQPGFLASLINKNWSEARQEIQAGLLWGPCCTTVNKNRRHFLAHLLPEVGVAELAPYMGWVQGSIQVLGQRGGLGRLPTPKVVLSTGVMCNTMVLLRTLYFCSQLFRSGSWVFLVFLYLLSRICPNCACTQLFLVP